MEFLIDITLKSTLILLFSGLILLGLKNASATLRHWIISLTMIGLLLLPLLVALVPDMEVTVPYLPPNEIVVAEKVEAPLAVPLQINKPVAEVVTTVPLMEESTEYTPIASTKIVDNQEEMFLENVDSRVEPAPISFIQLLPLIWLFGCGFFLLKFCFGLLGLRKITINSEPFTLPNELQNYQASYTKRPVRFLQNSSIKTPMTWGGFRPVILLPEVASVWSTSELKTVLIHELNHIKRNDYWVHTLGLLAVCLYWCNPLIWLMKRQQLLEREKACDEAVLLAGIRQQNYAEQLVNIARQLSGKPSMISENALPMAKMSQTKARVLAILNFDDDSFQFSIWKQRNWGLLYVLLFPILAAFSPVGKELINTKFELPEIENINSFLKTERLGNEPIKSKYSTELVNSEIQNSITTTNATVLSEQPYGNGPNQSKIKPLAPLMEVDFSLPVNHLNEAINIPKKPLKTGLFRKWEEGKSTFKLWTYGEFKIIPEAPYLEVISDDGIIFIEEYVPGIFTGKSNQLTIAKAPYDCRERPNYKKALDMRPEALIKKGMPIKIWSDNRDYDKWILSKGKLVAQHLMDNNSNYLIKEVGNDSEWWTKIEEIKNWIDFYFISEPDSKAKLERREKRKALKLGSIPFKKLDYPNKSGQYVMIGNTTLSGNNVGNMNTSPKGTKYMTVLDGGDKPALVKNFNFHLSENDFKKLEFDLQLYNMEDGAIKYAITKAPIPITVEKGIGWVKVDLSNYEIISKGKVLVVLENKDFSGTKNRKKLYFSLTDSHHDYKHQISANFEWKTKRILERDFVMYLGVEQVDELSEKVNNQIESGYLVKFQKGESSYKIWTYGDFKTQQTAPYIEVVNPDGVVIVEETTNKAIGRKTCRFIITKAPHDGIFVQNFKDNVINDFKGVIENNTPLYLLPTKKDWVFLRTDGEDWMSENLPNVFWELGRLINGSSDYQPTTEKDLEWWSVIQNHQAMKAKRFKALKPDLKISGQPGILPFSAIPYKAIQPEKLKGNTKKIGRTKATNTMSGSSGGEMKGSRFGTLLKGSNQKGLIQDFNLNIYRHKFKSLAFDCYFFKVKNNEIQHAFNEKPIRIEIDEETGWTSHDLTEHKIGIEGNVLVVIEVADYTAEQTELFFAQAPIHFMYKPKDKFYQGQKLEFWDSAFAMNMTVKQ